MLACLTVDSLLENPEQSHSSTSGGSSTKVTLGNIAELQELIPIGIVKQGLVPQLIETSQPNVPCK